MKLLRLYLLSTFVSFVVISALCIGWNQPLIFQPIRYDLQSFLSLLFLLAILSFGLVFVTLAPISWLNSRVLHLKNTNAYYAYFFALPLIALMSFALLAGYIESFFTPHMVVSPFYYFYMEGNSRLYLVGGALTTLPISMLFAAITRTEQAA